MIKDAHNYQSANDRLGVEIIRKNYGDNPSNMRLCGHRFRWRGGHRLPGNGIAGHLVM